MSSSYESPDKELMLRSRSAELLPPLRVQIAQAPPAPSARPMESAGLLEYLMIFRRRGLFILGSGVLCAAVGLLITLPQRPMYRARTSVEIQNPNDNFLNMRDIDPGTTANSSSESYVETQTQILKDDDLIEHAGYKAGLERRPDLFGLHRTPTREDIVGLIKKHLTVKASNLSHVIEIQVDAPDSKAAAGIANALANELIDQNLQNRWNAAQKTAEWLAGPLKELKQNLEKSATTLENYARSTGLTFNTDKGSTTAEDKLRQVQEELSRAQGDLAAKKARYEAAKTAPIESLPEVLDNGPLRDAQARLSELRRQEAELTSNFTPAYFKVKSVRAQIAELEGIVRKERQNILERIHNEYQAAQEREQLMAADFAKQSRVVSDQAGTSINYYTLKRELDTNRTLYEATLQKVKEATIASAIRASNIRVISQAKPSLKPISPQPLINTGAGLLAGLFLGAAVAVIREQTDRRIRRPGEVAAHLNILELGTIPSSKKINQPRARFVDVTPGQPVENGKISKALVFVRREPAGFINWSNDSSALAEAFRSTLASLWFAGKQGRQLRVFVVSSPHSGEGKSTLVSHLATALANTNRRVLIVDGDLRKPSLHAKLGLKNDFGLAEVLEDVRPIEDYSFLELFQETDVDGLYLLAAGSGIANVAGMRYHERLTELMCRIRLEFQAVLIDTPPALEFSDARVLGGLSDAAILVFRAAATTRDAASATLRRFEEDGIPVLGSVLNDLDPRDAKRHYGSYYRGYGGANGQTVDLSRG